MEEKNKFRICEQNIFSWVPNIISYKIHTN